MANLFRVILVALWFFSGSASAVVPKVVGPCTPPPSQQAIDSVSSGYSSGNWSSSAPRSVGTPVIGGNCSWLIDFYNPDYSWASPYTQNAANGMFAGICPPNSTESGGSCVCNAGTSEVGGQCVPPVTCTSNAEKVDGVCQCKVGYIHQNGGCEFDVKKACSNWEALNYVFGGMLAGQEVKLSGALADGALFCQPLLADGAPANSGCRIQFDQIMVATNHDGSKTSYGKWSASPKPDSGGDLSCTVGTGAADTPSPPSPAPCPNGSPGTVNGLTVCVPRQPNNGVETGDKGITTTDDGTNTTKIEKVSTTTCKDNVCTTTTVTNTTVTNNTTGSSTSSSATTTESVNRGEFCAKNASNAQCNGTGTGTGGNGNGDGEKDPSQFGGACSAGFSCEGDAIQCAIAQEQHKRACKLFDDPSPESQLYDASKGKEGNQTADLPGNETISLAGRIDSSDALGGGAAGVSDLNVTVWGKSVSLPFSMLNPYLAALGNVLLAVSFLLALRIVARG